jgi:hypothetical protein
MFETIMDKIIAQVTTGTFSNSELDRLSQAIQFARGQLRDQVKSKLAIGDNVNYISHRTGKNVTGHVTKIAQKYATVRTIDGLWKVPMNMCTIIEEV